MFLWGGFMKELSEQRRAWVSKYSGSVSILALAFCMMFSLAALAQVNTASINGTVRDTSGAVIPGASVVLHNVDTNVDRTSLTNDVGNYSFVDIQPGHYTLSVSKPGFQTRTQAAFTLNGIRPPLTILPCPSGRQRRQSPWRPQRQSSKPARQNWGRW
jgi:hypothetical protein